MASERLVLDCRFRLDRVIARALLLGLLFVICPSKPSKAEGGDDTLLAYAINVHQTPMQTWGPGYGIYLGKNLFITAAHVAGRSWLTSPKVVIAGQEFPTRVVKEGSFDGTDLTLLSVDEAKIPLRLRLRSAISLCDGSPTAGRQVVTVVPEGTVRTRIISPEKIPAGSRQYSTAIADVERTGNSGSGVFDVQRKCLWGIMSRKISQSRTRTDTGKTEIRDIAKYFVPSADISKFLP